MPSTAPEAATSLGALLERAERVLERVEGLFETSAPPPDFSAHVAFRWRRRGSQRVLEPVLHPHRITLSDLRGIEAQAKLIDANTRHFVQGLPANNVLLTGARGTGKSSLVKAVLARHAPRGLRLVEVDKQDLLDLPDLVGMVGGASQRFIVFCDDLSFEADEPSYKALKAMLDGSIAAPTDNVLIYATSNRRHLMPEYMSENLETRYLGEEIHPGETVEEKISLSERFGLWISFHPFDQDRYLEIAGHWVERLGVQVSDRAALEREALQWALARGSRSGRVAWHFARDFAGRALLAQRAPARASRRR
jgi:predicted AAA+ superfamily ATPase